MCVLRQHNVLNSTLVDSMINHTCQGVYSGMKLARIIHTASTRLAHVATLRKLEN